jgi:uncharacterized protein (TIGR00106 family)
MVNKMIIAEFSVVPVGTASTSISDYVAKAVTVVERSGLRSMVTPMGTIVEAENIEDIMEIIKKAHNAAILAGAERLVTTIKIDDRRDKERRMEDKVAAVKAKMAQ